MEDIISWDTDAIGETEPITVTLEGEGAVDFQTAFGEYSEARGRGRRRKQRRRLDRIRRRQERRKLRRAGRMQAMKEREAMRTQRKTSRLKRREMGKEEDDPIEDSISEPMEEEEIVEEEYAEEPAYDDYGDSAGEEEAVDEETGLSDDSSGFTGDIGFDGQRSPSQEDIQWDEYYSANAEKITPIISDLSSKIEKNKELVKQLEGKIYRITARSQKTGMTPNFQSKLNMLNANVAKYRQRIADLEGKLASYSSFDDDFSEASGKKRREISRRRAEVRKAKKLARKQRKDFIRKRRRARIKELTAQYSRTMPVGQAMQKARQQARAENPFSVTEVDSTLQAKFSPNRIEVPAQDMAAASQFDGDTGLIGLDSYRDYDAPPVRNVELEFSSAAGGGRKISWGSIAIGVAVTVVGIMVYNRYIKK